MNYNTDETYFNITQVANLVGVVPATIRNWEKRSLFTAKRAANGYRIFTLKDIDVLRRLRSLSEQGLTMNAIRSLTYSIEPVAKTPNTNAIIPKTLLGEKWKKNRLSHGYSIEQVAKETGISPSYIHKIENAQANHVSFDILQKLASFYGENILSYYEHHTAAITPFVKRGKGKKLSIDLAGVMLTSLVGCHNQRLTPMIYQIQPNCGRLEAHAHNGEELVYIIAGNIKFTLGENSYVLSTGDSLHYDSRTPHKWINIGKTTAEMLWLFTPKEEIQGLIDNSSSAK